jgi:hypothetical protein
MVSQTAKLQKSTCVYCDIDNTSKLCLQNEEFLLVTHSSGDPGVTFKEQISVKEPLNPPPPFFFPPSATNV